MTADPHLETPREPTPTPCIECGMRKAHPFHRDPHYVNAHTFVATVPESPAVAAPVGTSACPICGVDTPHGHDSDTVRDWNNRPWLVRAARSSGEDAAFEDAIREIAVRKGREINQIEVASPVGMFYWRCNSHQPQEWFHRPSSGKYSDPITAALHVVWQAALKHALAVVRECAPMPAVAAPSTSQDADERLQGHIAALRRNHAEFGLFGISELEALLSDRSALRERAEEAEAALTEADRIRDAFIRRAMDEGMSKARDRIFQEVLERDVVPLRTELAALRAERDAAVAALEVEKARLDELQRLIVMCDHVELMDSGDNGETLVYAAGDVAGQGNDIRAAIDQSRDDWRNAQQIMAEIAAARTPVSSHQERET